MVRQDTYEKLDASNSRILGSEVTEQLYAFSHEKEDREDNEVNSTYAVIFGPVNSMVSYCE